jgi:hypothetical protein
MSKTNDTELTINTAAPSEQKSTNRELNAEELEHVTGGNLTAVFVPPGPQQHGVPPGPTNSRVAIEGESKD